MATMATPRDIEGEANSGVSADATALPPGSPQPDYAPPQNFHNLPVGARLAHFWKRWLERGASKEVVEILRWGLRLEFWVPPFLTEVPINSSDNRTKGPILQEQVDLMLQKQAIERVYPPYGPGYYSRIFVVPKPNGKWRPIIDLSKLNKLLKIPTFRMESIQSVWSQLLPGNYTFSIDLTDAYFHIPIHPRYRKYLRFFFKGKVYQFRALPFGLSTAPYIFTLVMSEVKVMIHLKGGQLFLYLDDWLAQIQTYLDGLKESELLQALVMELGLLINREKSELIPSQTFAFIGAYFRLDICRVYPKEENLQKLVAKLKEFLRLSWATARNFQRLLGTVSSQFRFFPYGRLFLRPLQWHLASQWDQLEGNPQDWIFISPQMKACLRWWLAQTESPVGVPLRLPECSVSSFTDASEQGWGAHVQDAQETKFQGLWSNLERGLHSNVLEMRAVRLALERVTAPVGSVILISTDNTTVKSHINKQGGTRSWSLMEETVLLFQLAIRNSWHLKARHIPGKLNVLADNLSRVGQILPTEWSLNQEVADLVFARWHRPLIDLCATR